MQCAAPPESVYDPATTYFGRLFSLVLCLFACFCMQSAQPVRRRTPLNLYVAYLRANGGVTQDERTDALIKMLQELKPEHPEEVSRTAQAAAEIAGQ
jgi:hypothetical protein